MELKVLIADDDEGMRLVLRKAVQKVEGFILVGEASSGDSALGLAESLKPQVIFMDIDMPGMSGLECAKRVMDINPKTFIVFATAHEEYMSEAFQLYASDYIVKPFKLERVYQTLHRIRSLYQETDQGELQQHMYHKSGLGRIMIKNKEGVSVLDIESIIFVQREDRSTVIYSDNARLVTSESLSELEERLDGSLFLRSHKSYIINLSKIDKIYPYGRWTYIIQFKNTDKDALITHEKYEELQKIFQG